MRDRHNATLRGLPWAYSFVSGGKKAHDRRPASPLFWAPPGRPTSTEIARWAAFAFFTVFLSNVPSSAWRWYLTDILMILSKVDTEADKDDTFASFLNNT